MLIRRSLPLALAVLLLTVAARAEQPKHALTVEDVWKVKRLGPPAISPDGKWVAVEVTTYDMDENDSSSSLWLLATDGKTQRQLTTQKGKNSGPAWSPDGKRIAFVSKRDGDHAQVYLIAPDGGEAVQLTHMPMAPSGLKWAPDGKALYCIARTWPDTPDDESYKKKAKAHKDDKVKALVIDDALYRVWDEWIADGRRPVVPAVDAATGKHKNLFAGLKLHLPIYQPSAKDYDISPDGKEICFTADSVKEIGTDFNSDLYVMPLDKAGEPKNITTDNPGNDFQPLYSPDGSKIGFLRQTTKFFYADRKRLMEHDRQTGEKKEIVSLSWKGGTFDRTIENFRCVSVKDQPADKPLVMFEAEDRGYVRLFISGRDTAFLIGATGGHTDHGIDVSRDGTVVFLRSDFGRPGTLSVLDNNDLLKRLKDSPLGEIRDTGIAVDTKVRSIDHFSDNIVSQWHLGEVKDVTFKGADNDDVQMWIVYPPDFDPKKKWPLLQVVHGGPHGAITNDFHFRWNLHLMAAKGYVVSCINFHGSSGFGQKFTDSITGDLGTKPMIDIMKGTDYMEAQPYIDRDRMAAAGASYGGYMMAWLNGHTDRFKAMVCHAGVYNWHSMMASDFVRARERPLGALPWGDLAQIDKQSPQRFAAHFKTPTLVTHGEKDYRVPVTQGLEYYSTLRLKGVPTRLVYFPDENHWVLKPQNSRLWHKEFFAWLDKYVGHGPTK